jgi:predicted nucleic acid-binding protein
MPNRIIDCCSLLNLYAGWGGLENLRLLEHSWFICKTVEGESQLTREYDEHHEPQDRELVLQPFVQSGLIQVIAPETDEEFSSYIEFAQLIDDGEAQAIALAKHRALTLLTDDRKALKLAHRPDVGINTISTVDVLREWIERGAIEIADVRNTLTRIRELARFAPAKNTADLTWWIAQLNAS